MNLQERKDWIKEVLERGNWVQAARPHQMFPDVKVTKILTEYREDPDTDADLKTRTEGNVCLLNPDYTWEEVPPTEEPPTEYLNLGHILP